MKKKLEVGDKVLLISRTFKDFPVTGEIVAMVGERYVVYCKACDIVYLFHDYELEKYTTPSWTFKEEEKIIFKHLDIQYNYIARDKDGTLKLYTCKPTKTEDSWYSGPNGYSTSVRFFNNIFKNIKWEDSEACEFKKYL